jgi:hypothetical protein
VSFYVSTATFFFAPLWRMGSRCSSAETQVCHRSYIIAASISQNLNKVTLCRCFKLNTRSKVGPSLFVMIDNEFHIAWYVCRLTVTWRVSLVEQELLVLPEHLGLPLVFCVVFCRSLFILDDHCIACLSSIYGLVYSSFL